jgi:antirestriction protein ArdC
LKLKDLYRQVTMQIVAELEAGAVPWTKPWRHTRSGSVMPQNFATGRPYSGINIPILWGAAVAGGYDRHQWLTYKQAQALGGNVRKGEHGSVVVFTKKLVAGEDDEAKLVSMLRTYAVFNVAQVDGLPEATETTAEMPEHERLAAVETFVAATSADVRIGGNQPMYVSSPDFIAIPALGQFRDANSYYATLLHECGHYAVSRIMPHGARRRLVSLALAMRQLGIIRALRGTQGAGRRAGTGSTGWLGPQRGRAPSPSTSCRRGCRSGWSRRSHDQAKVRSRLDRRHGGAGPSPYCGEAYAA